MRSSLLRAASLAAPPGCAVCDGGCGAAEVLCGACRAALAVAPPVVEAGPAGIELAVAACRYEGAARGLVLRLKFARRLALAEPAAELVARACPSGVLRGELVPVPPSPLRRRWRGFDPAEEIALALASVTALPLRRCLRRRPGPRQVGRPRELRMSDPPHVIARGRVPARALLVDDVHTTGATLAACARALRGQGARSVIALTLARSR